MEYVIVSSFALLLSISAVAWISKIVKQRIDSISSKLGTDPGDFDVSLDTSP